MAPAISKSQFRFMKNVENGSIKKTGLSPEAAKEYTSHNTGNMSFKNLPKLKRIMKK
jgi:hypothetical protein